MENQRISNEQLVMDDLQKIWALRDHPDLKAKDIWKWIVSVERGWNIKAYYKVLNWKLKFLFYPSDRRELSDFSAILGIMWVTEIKDWKGVYDIYLLTNIDNNTGKPKIWTKPEDIHSLKYFKYWDNALFFQDRILIRQWINKSSEWLNHEITENEIIDEIRSWSLRIKDLKIFKDSWQISKPIFDKYLPALKKLLSSQILDTRFNLVKDPVSEEEIHDYIVAWHVSKEFAIKSWVLKLKDLRKYKEQWLIDEKTITKYWPVLWKLLLKQIGDIRFDFVNNPITENEIQDYLNSWYITKEFARKCYFELQEIKKKKEENERKKRKIHAETKAWIKDIQLV